MANITHQIPSWRGGNTFYLLIVIMALAAAVRVHAIDAHGLWYDEKVSVCIAMGDHPSDPVASEQGLFTARDFWAGNTIGNVVRATNKDNGNGLLYHVVLHYWIKAFGTTDLSVRLLSALFGTLIVLLVYFVAAQLCSNRIAIVASCFAAFHPLLVRYSQEARPYALATLLSLVATLLFIKLIQVQRPKSIPAGMWLLYGLTAGASLLSHFLTGYVFLGHIAYAAVSVRSRTTWFTLSKGGMLAAMILCAWMMVGAGHSVNRKFARMEQIRVGVAGETNPSCGESVVPPATPYYLLAGVVQTLLHTTGNWLDTVGYRLRTLLPLLLIPLGLLVTCRQAYLHRAIQRSAWLFGVLACMGLLFSLIMALLWGNIIPLQPLYANFATPYLIILLAVGITQIVTLKSHLRHVVICLAIAQGIIVLASLKLVYDDFPGCRPPNPHPALAARIVETADPGNVIVYQSWLDARMCNLHLPSNCTILQRVNPCFPADSVELIRADSEQSGVVMLSGSDEESL